MKEIQIKTKSLKVNWTSEMASDLASFHGLNVEEELNGIIRGEMRKRSIVKIWKSKKLKT
jgi:hypothetical protein